MQLNFKRKTCIEDAFFLVLVDILQYDLYCKSKLSWQENCELCAHKISDVSVTFFNGLYLTHVRMSPWARTSALDEWLWFIKCNKILDLGDWMTWLGGPDEGAYDWHYGCDSCSFAACVLIVGSWLYACSPRSVWVCVRSLVFWHLLDQVWLAPGSHAVVVPKTLDSLHRARISRDWRLRIGLRLSRIDALAVSKGPASTALFDSVIIVMGVLLIQLCPIFRSCLVWGSRVFCCEVQICPKWHRQLPMAVPPDHRRRQESGHTRRSLHSTRGCRRENTERQLITRVTSKNPQQTTDTCSPFSGSPSHHLQYTFRALFYNQPQIQYRGPRPKAHWYMYWIILI